MDAKACSINANVLLSDRHHFDNPVYSTSFNGANGANRIPAAANSQHLPLNNGCSRVVNHLNPKKHVNIEREKLATTANHYQDDTEEDDQESGMLVLGLGCNFSHISHFRETIEHVNVQIFTLISNF